MARLPQPGGDSGNWGTILNDYLMQAHDEGGILRTNAVTTAAIAPEAISSSKLSSSLQSTITHGEDAYTATTGRLSAPNLNATYAALGDGMTAGSVILFGTSLENQNGSGADVVDPASGTALNGRGWFHWTNAYLGNQLKLIRNSGIGSNTYAQMLARVDADVLAYNSDWVFMGGPTNDTSTGRTTVEIIADITALLDKLKSRKVLLLTAPPTSAHSGTEITVLFEINAWIRQLPLTHRNIIVVDVWSALAAPGSVTPLTGMTTDGIHYSASGAVRIGKLAADALRPWIASAPAGVSNAIDPTSVIANPTFDSSGSGWTAQGTGVSAAYTLAEDTFVNKAVLTYSGVTSTGNLGVQYEENISGGRFAPGNQIQVTARIKWTNTAVLSSVTNWGPVLLVQRVQTDNTVNGGDHVWGFVPSAQLLAPVGVPASGTAVVTTSILTIPSSSSPINRLRIRVGFRGIESGTVEVTDIVARKL